MLTISYAFLTLFTPLILVFSAMLLNFFLFIIGFICILGDCNRVPFDLPEAESELIAGFMTEFSSIYFSVIVLAEYANIVFLLTLLITLFSLYPLGLIPMLILVSLIRATLNRYKFDELMSNCWLVILPIVFSFLILSLLVI